MPELVYLKLRDDVGIAPSHIVNDKGLEVPNPKAGEPDVLTSIGLQIPMPVMIGDQIGTETRTAYIRPGEKLGPEGALADSAGEGAQFHRARIIPGTRIIETDHPAVVDQLLQNGYAQVDAPKSEQPRKPKQTVTDEGE